MVHENVTSNWVYEHYVIYLYLSIADSDCIVSNKELEDIRCRSFPLLEEERCSSLINEVYKEFWSHTEEERIKYIKENASSYLRTDFIKNKLIQHLEEVVKKDEDSEEYVMFRFIRKVINNSK